MHLNPQTERGDIEAALAGRVRRAALRTSPERRSRLQRNARRQARHWDLTLEIDESHPTAHVEQDVVDGESAPHIVVTGREIDQPVTDYDGRAWDWLVHRAFGVHEVGHVRYSDTEHLQDCLKALDQGIQGFAKQAWNALEDGRMECQVVNRWPAYAEPLRALRANLFAEHEPGIDDIERGGRVFPMAHAIFTALMDLWMRAVYDVEVGALAKLADPTDDTYHCHTDADFETFTQDVLPLCHEVVADVLGEADARAANARIMEFVEAVQPYIDQADSDGKAQMNREEGQAAGMPDDANESHAGGDADPADRLGDGAPGEIDTDDIDQPGAQVAADLDTDADLEAEAVDRAAGQAREQAGLSDDLLSDLEEMVDACGAADADLRAPEIVLPDDDPDLVEGRWADARGAAQPFAQLLRNRLQHEREDRVERDRDRGRFTGRGPAALRAIQGERSVKEQRIRPDEKAYHFAFGIDRSGSMSGAEIDAAERALTRLVLALEDVGVRTAVFDLHQNRIELAKSFAQPAERVANRLCSDKTGGGTPLHELVVLARERLKREPTADTKAMVVITDDRPGNTEAFHDAIAATPFPVLGVNITNGSSDAEQLYHRSVSVSDVAEIDAALRGMIQEVMF